MFFCSCWWIFLFEIVGSLVKFFFVYFVFLGKLGLGKGKVGDLKGIYYRKKDENIYVLKGV